jgi:hypothetical protein
VERGWSRSGDLAKARLYCEDVWVHRTTTVRGTVTGLAPAELVTRLARLHVFVMPDTEERDDPCRPWASHWIARRGFSRIFFRVPPIQPDGSFAMEVPAIRGLTFVARARGFRPVWRTVTFVGGEAKPVTLPLETPSIRLRGTVRRPDGAPVKYGQLHVYLIADAAPGLRMDTIRPAGGGAFTCGRRVRDGKSVVVFSQRKGTSLHRIPGRFDVELGWPGDVVLYVHAEGGFAPFRLDLGRVEADPEPLRIILERTKTRDTVTLLEDGRPLDLERVALADHSLPGPRPMVQALLGDGGALPTAWLVPGHRYVLSTSHGLGLGRLVCFVWRPAKTLEISDLPREEPEDWKEEDR